MSANYNRYWNSPSPFLFENSSHGVSCNRHMLVTCLLWEYSNKIFIEITYGNNKNKTLSLSWCNFWFIEVFVLLFLNTSVMICLLTFLTTSCEIYMSLFIYCFVKIFFYTYKHVHILINKHTYTHCSLTVCHIIFERRYL